MPQAGMGCTVGARMIRAAFLGRMGCAVGNRLIGALPVGGITLGYWGLFLGELLWVGMGQRQTRIG
jgi:hypothetical protein